MTAGGRTPDRRRVVGAVLSGGRSSRFGRDKALEPVGDRAMMQVVVDAIRSAGVDPVVAIGGSAGHTLGLPTVADRRPGLGPLGGVDTALHWARRGHVLVAPCDLPLLRGEHLVPLLSTLDAMPEPEVARAGAGRSSSATADGVERAVVAMVDGTPVQQLALWPAGWWPDLRVALDNGRRRLATLLELGPWIGVEVPAEAVRDADDPASLQRLREADRATTDIADLDGDPGGVDRG